MAEVQRRDAVRFSVGVMAVEATVEGARCCRGCLGMQWCSRGVQRDAAVKIQRLNSAGQQR